jgi:putative ABC transport system permease protein
MHAIEYAILAGVTTALAVVLGGLAAWASVRRVMDVPFVFSWGAVGQALGVSLLLVFILGLSSTLRVLQARPVPYLRTE